MTLLTREEILKKDDLSYEEVNVPEWGGIVRLYEITAAQRDHLEMAISGLLKDQPEVKNIRAKLVSLSLKDENGKLLFPKEKDVLTLGKKSAKVIERLFSVAQELSGMSKDFGEETEKN